jgi:hypothetical protein
MKLIYPNGTVQVFSVSEMIRGANHNSSRPNEVTLDLKELKYLLEHEERLNTLKTTLVNKEPLLTKDKVVSIVEKLFDEWKV